MHFAKAYTAIAAAPQHFHLVVLHHNALPVGSAWLDAHQLQGGDAFLEALVAYPQVKIAMWTCASRKRCITNT